jgi:CelD/BcsL family acetyltransferase involved in cellulose biosynthesis
MRVRAYTEADAETWDAFCADAPMATFLHSRRFLSYHGERFQDASLVVEDDQGHWLAVLPAALGNAPGLVVSHPGATYGGLVHRGRLLGEVALGALAAVCRHYAAAGFTRLRYKAVPRIYHRRPADDEGYALFRLDAARYRCDLSCAIDLANRGPVSERRRRGARKAAKAGVVIGLDDNALAEFWPILADNLARRHEARPVHSLTEIQLLQARFPDAIRLMAARQGDALVAGTLLFCTATTVHAQYIASSEAGRDAGALDAVFEQAIAWAADRGSRCFDFGISNEDEGRTLNRGLYDFKTEFGASGVLHEFYDIDLTRSLPCP